MPGGFCCWKDGLSIMVSFELLMGSFLSVVGGPAGECGWFGGEAEEKEKAEKDEELAGWRVPLLTEEGEVILVGWLVVFEKPCDCMNWAEVLLEAVLLGLVAAAVVMAAAVISGQCRWEGAWCGWAWCLVVRRWWSGRSTKKEGKIQTGEKKKKSDEQNDGHVEKFNETGSTRRVQPSGFNKMERKMWNKKARKKKRKSQMLRRKRDLKQ